MNNTIESVLILTEGGKTYLIPSHLEPETGFYDWEEKFRDYQLPEACEIEGISVPESEMERLLNGELG